MEEKTREFWKEESGDLQQKFAVGHEAGEYGLRIEAAFARVF